MRNISEIGSCTLYGSPVLDTGVVPFRFGWYDDSDDWFNTSVSERLNSGNTNSLNSSVNSTFADSDFDALDSSNISVSGNNLDSANPDLGNQPSAAEANTLDSNLGDQSTDVEPFQFRSIESTLDSDSNDTMSVPDSNGGPCSSGPDSTDDSNSMCSICMGEIKTKAYPIICLHEFCLVCILQWS